MFVRARLFVLVASLLLLSSVIRAQVQWQPSAPPLVTAENESWFHAGAPLIWNGDYYYPAGARQFFDPYEMVRAGSFRGIPLYTDATREPFSIVFVPLSGGLMQPYERRRSGALAGTTGSTAPSFPTDIAGEGLSTGTGGLAVDVAQNPGPASRARAYDVAPIEDAGTTGTAGTVGTSAPMMTSIAPARTTTRATRGESRIWVDYDGRRWYANGVAIPLEPRELVQHGIYHGFPIYVRPGDADTIYVPAAVGGLVTPFRAQSRH